MPDQIPFHREDLRGKFNIRIAEKAKILSAASSDMPVTVLWTPMFRRPCPSSFRIGRHCAVFIELSKEAKCSKAKGTDGTCHVFVYLQQQTLVKNVLPHNPHIGQRLKFKNVAWCSRNTLARSGTRVLFSDFC